MKISLHFLLSTISVLISYTLLAQVNEQENTEDVYEYSLRSLDGKLQKITIVNDYQRERFIIGTGEDTICLFENFGSPQFTYLDSSFLKMVYLQHGGMGLVKFDVAVLCIKNGKPYIALNMRESESFVIRGDQEQYSYHADISLKRDERDNHQMAVSLDYQYKVKGKLKRYARRKKYSNNVVLKFDDQRCIFYNDRREVYKTFDIVNIGRFKGEESVIPKMEFTGVVFDVVLGEWKYRFYNGDWYRNSEMMDMIENDKLYNCTSKCFD